MKQTLRYKNGNSLSYAEYGDPNGFPILIQHGMVASIIDDHIFDRLKETGARLICTARPGYGDSSPYEMRNIAEWGEIVSVLVDSLGLARFDVFGISSGAPYSYAVGYHFPDRVRNLFILSGIPALYDKNVVACWPYPVDTNATLAETQALARDLFFSNLSEADLEKDDIKDSMMHDCFGPALDLKIRGRDWGFQLPQVKPRVTMRHSKTDNVETAQITARLLPDCTLELRENDPHFSQEVLDDFIRTVIAGHYEK